jgi:hypothetical protein
LANQRKKISPIPSLLKRGKLLGAWMGEKGGIKGDFLRRREASFN